MKSNIGLSGMIVFTKVKKSTSPAFKGLQAGDKMQFKVNIGHKNGAVFIECINMQTKEISKLSFNQLSNMLSQYEYEEL